MVHLSTLLVVGAGICASAAAFDNSIFLIRHGEKPDGGGQGLSDKGEDRAKCIKKLFNDDHFNIGYILAEKPQKNGDRTRPVDTVTPLAKDLDLKVDTSCDRDDAKCVEKAVNDFAKDSKKNILICWEHKALTDIMDQLGVNDPPKYPDDKFDVIFTVKDEKLDSKDSENCDGLD